MATDELGAALDRCEDFEERIERADPAERAWIFAARKDFLTKNLAEVLAAIDDPRSLGGIDRQLGVIRSIHNLEMSAERPRKGPAPRGVREPIVRYVHGYR